MRRDGPPGFKGECAKEKHPIREGSFDEGDFRGVDGVGDGHDELENT